MYEEVIPSYTIKNISEAWSIFSKLYPIKPAVIDEHDLIFYSNIPSPIIVEEARKRIHSVKGNITYYHYKLNDNNNLYKMIKEYDEKHLFSSIIKEFLNNIDDSLGNWVAYILYYYEFFKSKTVEGMRQSVINDIKSIIVIIIKKELTKYREFNTEKALYILRQTLASEQLMKYSAPIGLGKPC